MSKTAVKFGQDLQATLQVMVVKPSSIGGLQVRALFRDMRNRLTRFYLEQAMQEAIACLCVVVNNLTHEHGRLVGLLKSCLGQYPCVVRGFMNSTLMFRTSPTQGHP
jgi:cohesin loading factor subunit SCC2